MNDMIKIAKEMILKFHKKNKAISFNELWKKSASAAKIKDAEDEDIKSEFYLLLLEDPNFIKLPNNEWTLKQFYSYDEVEKMSNNFLKTDEFEIQEGEYDKFLSKYELDEMKNKYRNSDTSALDVDEYDDNDFSDEMGDDQSSSGDSMDDSDYDV